MRWQYLFIPTTISITYNLIKLVQSPVKPTIGSIVYCELLFGYLDHSGIYIGNNKIVHLNRRGIVEVVTPAEFIKGTMAFNIYVSCQDKVAVGSLVTALTAKQRVNRKYNYNLVTDNCHKFTIDCISLSGLPPNTLTELKSVTRATLRANSWRRWQF